MKTIRIILFLLILSSPKGILSCDPATKTASAEIVYREEMRQLIMLISTRAKRLKPGFFIVPQNGLELLTDTGTPRGELINPFINAIDGIGCEELFYGHRGDGIKTTKSTTDYFLPFLIKLRKQGKSVLVIDYTAGTWQKKRSVSLSKKYGFISFQGQRGLSRITLPGSTVRDDSVSGLADVQNFLYIINPQGFHSAAQFVWKLSKTRFDLLILDAFFWERPLTVQQVNALKRKPSGKRRLVLAYMSIGEAESYRFYWKKGWKRNPPSFLCGENPEWKGNYKVRYWLPEWKEIICGRDDGTGFEKSYLKRIIDAGFDGVYLDILDAAFYFEKKAGRCR